MNTLRALYMGDNDFESFPEVGWPKFSFLFSNANEAVVLTNGLLAGAKRHINLS